MSHKENQTPVEYSTYQTGSTTPPKKYSVLLAVLLVLVVILSGLVSILGLLNSKMFEALYEDQVDEVPVSLQKGELAGAVLSDDIATEPSTKIIGITGEPVTEVYQRHFQLPEGLFITFVEEGTSAHRQGIREGDVLLSLGDTPITQQEHIRSFLENRSIGEEFQAVVYRRDSNRRFTVLLTIEETTS